MSVNKKSFKEIDYHAAILASKIKSPGKYCEAMKAMLEANGWTEEEFIKYTEGFNN